MDPADRTRCTRTARTASPAAADRACPWTLCPDPASRRADPGGFRRCSRRRGDRYQRSRRAGPSFLALPLRFLGGPFLLGDLVFIEIPEGLRDGVHGERALIVRDRELVERHDARQLRDIARERAHVVIAAGYFHRDRQLGIEVSHLLGRGRLEELELQASSETRLID